MAYFSPHHFNLCDLQGRVLMETIREKLIEASTERHRDFMRKLLPTVEPERILGVKVSVLRKIAKELPKDYLDQLPHLYYEEDMLHDFVINRLNREEALEAVQNFLPYLDNWAVVDSLDPKSFYGDPSLMEWYLDLSEDPRPYAARLGIVLALRHIREDTSGAINRLKNIRSDHYYVQMALGWFFAEAVLYAPGEVLTLVREGELEKGVHKKTIRKINESRRVAQSIKEQASAYR